jgi:hypothetical protein
MRELFVNMHTNKNDATELLTLSNNTAEVNSLLKAAYYSAAEMFLSQYKLNPFSKIEAFNLGKHRLDGAIEADTMLIESRYLRYTIQQNAPSLLKYTDHLKSDRRFLINTVRSIKTTDPDLYTKICSYLLLKANLNKTEKMLIQS